MIVARFFLSVALTGGLATIAVPVLAQDEQALVPLPSILDFSQGAGFAAALGVSAEFETAYDGADETELEVEPAGAVHYRRGNHLFFWEGNELGWRGRLADNWLVQAGVRNEGGLEPDDSSEGYLNGIEPRDSHVVGFLEVRRGLGTQWRNWVGARLMGGPSEFGTLGVLAAGHRFGEQTDGTGTEIYGFVTLGNGQFLDKDFGVTAADSRTSGLPAYQLSGGYRSTGIQLVHRRDLGDRLHAIAQAGVERYAGDIGNSPIARRDTEFELSVALVWRF
jgi:outer membrane scaffolding protein for murein synthesis (MipA/OmpV family)